MSPSTPTVDFPLDPRLNGEGWEAAPTYTSPPHWLLLRTDVPACDTASDNSQMQAGGGNDEEEEEEELSETLEMSEERPNHEPQTPNWLEEFIDDEPYQNSEYRESTSQQNDSQKLQDLLGEAMNEDFEMMKSPSSPLEDMLLEETIDPDDAFDPTHPLMEGVFKIEFSYVEVLDYERCHYRQKWVNGQIWKSRPSDLRQCRTAVRVLDVTEGLCCGEV